MTAKQAAELTAKHSVNPSQVGEIELLIEKAAKAGQRFIWFYKYFSTGVKDYLLKQGYSIDDMPDPRGEGPTIKISW